jgi:hypothetical protein
MLLSSQCLSKVETDERFDGEEHEQGDEPPDAYGENPRENFYDNENNTHGSTLCKFDVPDVEPLCSFIHVIDKFHLSPLFFPLHAFTNYYNGTDGCVKVKEDTWASGRST